MDNALFFVTWVAIMIFLQWMEHNRHKKHKALIKEEILKMNKTLAQLRGLYDQIATVNNALTQWQVELQEMRDKFNKIGL